MARGRGDVIADHRRLPLVVDIRDTSALTVATDGEAAYAGGIQ
jgi:hypothetical protein